VKQKKEKKRKEREKKRDLLDFYFVYPFSTSGRTKKIGKKKEEKEKERGGGEELVAHHPYLYPFLLNS